jgi:F0F1-type ATP synthase assembly protein I
MVQNNKAFTYRNMLLVSTLAGVGGVYFLYKGFKTLAWFLVGVWAVVGVVVRVLIIIDKKSTKNREEI